MAYKLTLDGTAVLKLNDLGQVDSVIPMSDTSEEYIKYLDWVKNGGIPEPAETSKDEWFLYGQTFTSVPTNFSSPYDVVYPQKPA